MARPVLGASLPAAKLASAGSNHLAFQQGSTSSLQEHCWVWFSFVLLSGLDDEQRVNVFRPPVASIESIFEIAASAEIDAGLFEVDPGGDRILVRMAQETFDLVQNLRENDPASRSVVMNGLYVPVVMEVLHRLSHGPEDFQSHRWFEPFHRRCDTFGVNFDTIELLSDAHKLLDLPFSGLFSLIDQEGNDDAN